MTFANAIETNHHIIFKKPQHTKFFSEIQVKKQALRPEALQQIVQALSAIWFFGNISPCPHMVLNFCASNHMTIVHQNLSNLEQYIRSKHITDTNGDEMQMFSNGQGHFSPSSSLTLHDVLFIVSLSHNF